MSAKKEYRRALLRSLEVETLRTNLLVMLVVLILGIVMTAGSTFLRAGADGLSSENWVTVIGILAAACGVVSLPYLIYCAYRIGKILRKPCSYRFYQVKLDTPHHSDLVRAMYFTVKLEEEDGTFLVKNTRAIFPTHGLGPRLEDVINKTVTIAYNPETDTVVVYG